MNVLVLTTMDNGRVQVDLTTGFCIYHGTAGKAVGTLTRECFLQVNENGSAKYASLDLLFDDVRIQDDNGNVNHYERSNKAPNDPAFALNTGIIMDSTLSEALAAADG